MPPWDVAGVLTEVLDVLVAENGHGVPEVLGASPGLGSPRLVDNDAVSDGRSDEGGAIGELGHPSVVVEADPRETIADGAEDQYEVAVGQKSASAVKTYIPPKS